MKLQADKLSTRSFDAIVFEWEIIDSVPKKGLKRREED